MMRLNIFGDLCLHGFDDEPSLSPIISNRMANAYNLVNLECPITDAVAKRPCQAKNLHVSPLSGGVEIVKCFDAVSLANNHVRDYLDAGCEDTIAFLEANGISYFGVGKSQDEAIQPLVFEREGIRVAVIGATRYANSDGCVWGTASDSGPRLLRMVRTCHQDGRFTIVYLHAGYEYVDLPAPRERKIARHCIDAGADLIVMSHPHVYQGFETYKDKSIFYSLGNFCFHASIMDELAAHRGDPRLMQSYYLSLSIQSDHSYVVEMRGYHIAGSVIEALTDTEQESMVSHIENISVPLSEPYVVYWRKYYCQAVDTCRQNKKVRVEFQRIAEQSLLDRMRIMMDFNSQDLRNRIANLIAWYFK